MKITIDNHPSVCNNCGSEKLIWQPFVSNHGGCQDGRIRLHETSCIFVLGCDECSETIGTVEANKVAAWLNEKNTSEIREIHKLQEAGKKLLEYIDDDEITIEDSAKLLGEMREIFHNKY